MTPAEAVGWKVGDRGVVRYVEPDPDAAFSEGAIVELYQDDNSTCPKFKLVDGECYYHHCGEVAGTFEDLENVIHSGPSSDPVNHPPHYTQGVSREYSKLSDVLTRAYEQASSGKGNDRHSVGQRFEEQPIVTIQSFYGSGFAFGQVAKKMEESQRMGKEAAVAELLGAINYIAAAIIHIEGDY